MRIGELAEGAGVSVRALRYYEEQELLVPDRSSGGHRRYPVNAVDSVRFIQLLFAAGLGSKTIKGFLPFLEDGMSTPEMLAQLATERARIRAKIDELSAADARLGDLIEEGARLRTPSVPMRCSPFTA